MTQSAPHDPPCDGALELLRVILDYVADGTPVPTHAELADQLQVTKRTIERWIQQLRHACLLHVAGRSRPVYVPRIGKDRLGSVRIGNITDPNRSLPTLTDPNRSCPFCGSGKPETPLTDPNRSSVGVGDSQSREITTPTSARRKPKTCTTALGRFLASNEIGAAGEFDARAAAGEIDESTYLAWFRDQLASGKPKNLIVTLARQGAPEGERVQPAPYAPRAFDPDELRRRYGDLFGPPDSTQEDA